jgi:hypothetical protein
MNTAVKIIFLSITLAFAVFFSAWAGRESFYLEIKVKTEPAPIVPLSLRVEGKEKGSADAIRGVVDDKTNSDGFYKLSFLLPKNRRITSFRFDFGEGVASTQVFDAKITKRNSLEIFQRTVTVFGGSDFFLFDSKTLTTTGETGKLQIQSSDGTSPRFGLKTAEPLFFNASLNWTQSGIIFALLFGLWLCAANKILPREFARNIRQLARLRFEDFNLPAQNPTDETTAKQKNRFLTFFNEKRVFVLAAFGLVLSITTYWFELTNYIFSADEGRAFDLSAYFIYFYELRWMQGLLVYVLPSEFAGLPFLATAICCVSFPLSAAILATSIFQRFRFQLLFTALFVTCPVLPYSIAFGDNSYGVALGYLLASLAVRIILSDKLDAKQLAKVGFLLACAVGIYQSHAFYFFGASVIGIIMRRKCLKTFFLSCLVCAFAVVSSLAIGKLFQFILGMEITRSYFDVNTFWQYFWYYAKSAVYVLSGISPLFLQVGIASMLAVYAGVCIAALRFAKNRRFPSLKVSAFFICAVLSAVAVMLLYRWGEIYRSLCAFVPLYAFVGACAASLSRPKWVAVTVASVSVLTNIYISTSLAYSDYISRHRDNIQAAAMYSCMIEVEPKLGRKSVKIAFEGKWWHEASSLVKQTSNSGSSFFENKIQLNLLWYFRLLGIKNLELVEPPPSSTLTREGAIANLSLPIWPDKKSIAYVGDVLLVRLENTFDINELKHLKKTGVRSELRDGFLSLWESGQKKNPDGLPILQHQWMISHKEESEKYVLTGLAYSKTEQREPDAYFLFEKRGGKWVEVPISTQETQIAELNGFARALQDNNALFSRYRLAIDKMRIAKGRQYCLVAYFHDARKLYRLSPLRENYDPNAVESAKSQKTVAGIPRIVAAARLDVSLVSHSK